MQKLGIGGGSLKGYGCQGLSLLSCAMAGIELVGGAEQRGSPGCGAGLADHTCAVLLTCKLLGRCPHDEV